jgi:hypothetical protein
MSEYAYFRFANLNLLDTEEKEYKEDVIATTEEVLDAHGNTCDSKISELSEEKVRDIHQLQRKIRISKGKRKAEQKQKEKEKIVAH